MYLLRNRFLNTASFLSGPDDPPGGKKPVAEVVGSMEDANDSASDDTGGTTDGEDGNDAGDDAGGDEEGGDGPDDESATGADDEDDPDLADLPPEARVKAKAAIERRVAKETGWRDRQIDRLHARTRNAQEDVRAAEAITKRQPAAKPGENLTAEQIEERARTLASQMSAQDKYDADANDCDVKGRATYGDKWKGSLARLPKLGGVDLPDMQDILSTDKPHVVLMSLTDPETYERVMSLPPARRRNEFVKLSLMPEPKPKVATKESKRPGDVELPVKPLNGSGRKLAAQRVDIYDDKAPDDAWYAARNATRRKKFSDHA